MEIKHNRPSEQKLIVRFSFGSHVKADSFHAAKKTIEEFKPHVYCPEMWTTKKEHATFMQTQMAKIEKARMNGVEKEKVLSWYTSPFDRAEFEFLIDSKPGPLLYVTEMHKDDSVQTGILGWVYLYSMPIASIIHGFEVARAFEIGLNKAYGEVQARRDQCVAENIATLRDDILQFYPQLSEENPLRVLIRFGSVHTSSFFRAKMLYAGSQSITIERMMHELPMTYAPDECMHRAVIFGKEIEPQWATYSIAFKVLSEHQRLKFGKDTSNREIERNLSILRRYPLDKISGAIEEAFSGLVYRLDMYEAAAQNLNRLCGGELLVSD